VCVCVSLDFIILQLRKIIFCINSFLKNLFL